MERSRFYISLEKICVFTQAFETDRTNLLCILYNEN